MASEAQNTIAPECPRNDRKTHGDGFGIPISVVFRDFETFFNKFLDSASLPPPRVPGSEFEL
jgi:hypothetical protein